jgi:hypothetical protein
MTWETSTLIPIGDLLGSASAGGGSRRLQNRSRSNRSVPSTTCSTRRIRSTRSESPGQVSTVNASPSIDLEVAVDSDQVGGGDDDVLGHDDLGVGAVGDQRLDPRGDVLAYAVPASGVVTRVSGSQPAWSSSVERGAGCRWRCGAGGHGSVVGAPVGGDDRRRPEPVWCRIRASRSGAR